MLIDSSHKDVYHLRAMRIKGQPWYRRLLNQITREVRWLTPGLGVKRWLLMILAGTTLIGLGFAVLVLDVYRTAPEGWWLPILSTLSLRFLARPLRALIFGGLGVSLVLIGTWGINRALLKPFVRPGRNLVDTVTSFRKRERGPRVVVIGGGNGLASLLRGLKNYTHNLTAIVTVADDGGSSGELRRQMGVLPPGDIRNCLAALSDDEDLITQLFSYRFASGAGLGGHTLGNLLITAVADITGSFEEGVAEMGKVLAVRGTVLPSTLHDVRLVADVVMTDSKREVRVKGESEIPKAAGKVRRVWLEPNNPLAYPPAIQALLAADMIVIGPGSLYTSILPNLLVDDLAAAVRSSRAMKLYVCNVATQPGETDGFSCADHVKTLEQHVGGDPIFDLVLCNDQCDGKLPNGVAWVCVDEALRMNYSLYQADLIDEDRPWRHDSEKLSRVILDLYYERTGPLINRSDDEK